MNEILTMAKNATVDLIYGLRLSMLEKRINKDQLKFDRLMKKAEEHAKQSISNLFA